MRLAISGLLVVGALCGACSDDDGDANDQASYEYTLEPKSGNTTLGGTAEIVTKGDKITLTVKLTDAPPGKLGVHIHEIGNCDAEDATSAGPHWNPTGHDHGAPDPQSHLGDLGNITVGSDGTGTLTVENAGWTLGDGSDTDLFGKALVVHGGQDDFATQPSGNSGARIGCTVLDKL